MAFAYVNNSEACHRKLTLTQLPWKKSWELWHQTNFSWQTIVTSYTTNPLSSPKWNTEMLAASIVLRLGAERSYVPVTLANGRGTPPWELLWAAQMNIFRTFFYFHFLFVCLFWKEGVCCCCCCYIVAQLTFTHSHREKRASRDMTEFQSITFMREDCLWEENVSHTLTFSILDLVHKHSHTQL